MPLSKPPEVSESPDSHAPPGADEPVCGMLEFQQSRFSHRTRFVFGERELSYLLSSELGRRVLRVPYQEVGRERGHLTMRHGWLRDLGLLCIALGMIFTAIEALGGWHFFQWVWMLWGFALLLGYRASAVHYIRLQTPQGELLIIEDEHANHILDALAERRAAYFKRTFDYSPLGASPEQLRARFEWLHREGALDDDELRERLRRARIEAIRRAT